MAHSPTPQSATPPATLRVVAIGGGTGLSTLLRGFKHFTCSTPAVALTQPPGEGIISELAAVVTVTDDGGSSGRKHTEILAQPPGDLRNCMVARHLLQGGDKQVAEGVPFKFAA